MQEILKPTGFFPIRRKEKAYNLEIFGVTDRVFKTFKLTPEDEKESVSFVTYWNAAVQLQDIIDQSVRVMERASKTKTLSQKLMKKLGKNDPDEMHRERQLSRLSMQAMRQITTLKMAGIPSEYWNIDAMNWVLVRWGQKGRIRISEACLNDMISTWRSTIPFLRRKKYMHINVSHFAALSYIMQGISHPSRRNTGIVSRTGRMVNRYSKNQNILPSIFFPQEVPPPATE